jgi:hypothetical protein
VIVINALLGYAYHAVAMLHVHLVCQVSSCDAGLGAGGLGWLLGRWGGVLSGCLLGAVWLQPTQLLHTVCTAVATPHCSVIPSIHVCTVCTTLCKPRGHSVQIIQRHFIAGTPAAPGSVATSTGASAGLLC